VSEYELEIQGNNRLSAWIWFAPEFVSQIGRLIKQHPRVSSAAEEHPIMTTPARGTDRGGRRSKRFLTPLQKYEIFLQLVRQEVTMAEAAEQSQVDRSTIMRIRTVAKEGALEALASAPPPAALAGSRAPPGLGPVVPRLAQGRTSRQVQTGPRSIARAPGTRCPVAASTGSGPGAVAPARGGGDGKRRRHPPRQQYQGGPLPGRGPGPGQAMAGLLQLRWVKPLNGVPT